MLIGGTACAGSSDRIPAPNGEQRDRIGRLAASLGDTARPAAAVELRDLLDSMCRFPPAAAATDSLARALASALNVAAPGDLDRQALAARLYDAMNGDRLRRPELEALVATVRGILDRGRVPIDAQDAVAAAIVRVAREETSPRTDWW